MAVTSRRTRSHTARDQGYTFVEMIVTIVLLGVIVIPVIDAVQATINASVVARAAAQVETAIVNAADRVNRAPLSCDYSQYAEAAVQTQGWGASQAATTTDWYDPIAHVWRNDGSGCRFDGPTSDLVQRVRISVTSPDQRVTRTIELVKSIV